MPDYLTVQSNGVVTYCDGLIARIQADQAEAYLELYCDRADMPMQVVRQWTSIVAASELARKRNVNDEFLKNWIDVVDYQ